MARQLTFLKSAHINQVVGDFDAAIDHYSKLLGAEMEKDFRGEFGPYDGCLMLFGRTRLEIFSSSDPTNIFARMYSRYGNFWHALQFVAPSIEEAVEILHERGIRSTDVDLSMRYSFADPRDTFGLRIQVGDGQWTDAEARNPAGILGLSGLTVLVNDADAAASFFVDLVAGARKLFSEERPKLSAHAAAIEMAGYEVEFLNPLGPGVLEDALEHYNQHIRSATFRVESTEKLRQFLDARSVSLIDGERPGTLAIPSSENLGILWQFSE